MHNRAICIGCGCTDFEACPEGCHWLCVDYTVGKGVCSNCPGEVERFDRGDLDIAIDTASCPECNAEQADRDGFGFIQCDNCGHCVHPDVRQERCVVCGEEVRS